MPTACAGSGTLLVGSTISVQRSGAVIHVDVGDVGSGAALEGAAQKGWCCRLPRLTASRVGIA